MQLQLLRLRRHRHYVGDSRLLHQRHSACDTSRLTRLCLDVDVSVLLLKLQRLQLVALMDLPLLTLLWEPQWTPLKLWAL